MWSDEEFIDFVNNNPDASQYLWTKNLILDGEKVIAIPNINRDQRIVLSEEYNHIPEINERVFNVLKVLTFNAVKNGGTVTFFVANYDDNIIWIGYNGRILDASRAGSENFRLTINKDPWKYKEKNTLVTFEFIRMYTSNKVCFSGGTWSGTYPEILKACMKALYKENYSDELYEYFKLIGDSGGFNEEIDKKIGEIDTFFMPLTGAPFINTKIK
jgi:hypothetical protein